MSSPTIRALIYSKSLRSYSGDGWLCYTEMAVLHRDGCFTQRWLCYTEKLMLHKALDLRHNSGHPTRLSTSMPEPYLVLGFREKKKELRTKGV